MFTYRMHLEGGGDPCEAHYAVPVQQGGFVLASVRGVIRRLTGLRLVPVGDPYAALLQVEAA